MRIGQLNKTIRSVIIPGRQFIVTVKLEGPDGTEKMKKAMECIAVYAHIATMREIKPPYLTRSYNWIDLHNMVIDGEITRRVRR